MRYVNISEISVIEQNPADSTFGFGVVFSDRALAFLAEDDPETHDAITPHLESWEDITIFHGGDRVRLDGLGFAAIERLKQVLANASLSFRFDMQRGQLQYVNNLELCHRRTRFEDHPEPERKRLMVRVWLRDAGQARYHS